VELRGRNGESYEEVYRRWISTLTPVELEELKANGLHKPLRDDCTHTPDYSSVLNRAHDDPASDDEPESKTPITNESERLAMILLFLADSQNPRLELYTLMWLLGFTSMIGVSREAVAARFGLSKAAFSKRCKILQHRFCLPPNRAMKKSTEYRWSNGAMPIGAKPQQMSADRVGRFFHSLMGRRCQ
jgi:hypothetical protein